MQCKYILLRIDELYFLYYHIDKIFLTHGHHDHCSGIAKLLNEIGELPVYMSERTIW